MNTILSPFRSRSLLASCRYGVAAATILGVFLAWYLTLAPETRMGRISSQTRGALPTILCPTGYDDRGACVLQNLAGGVHSFLLPGLIGASIVLLGGLVFGVLLAHERSPIKRLVAGTLSALEAIPRLGLLLLVFVLFEHSPLALGIALGIVGIPACSELLAERFYRLQQTQFIAASRAHGISEGRILGMHVIWLECRSVLQQQALQTFAGMLLAESALCFALQSNSSPTELSWGYQLHRTLVAVYRPTLSTLPPFLSVAGAFLLVLWSSWLLGNLPVRQLSSHPIVEGYQAASDELPHCSPAAASGLSPAGEVI